MIEFKLKSEYITLGKLIKALDLIDSGGMIKMFLSETNITLNNELENRRGKKIYKGDFLIIDKLKCKIV